MTMTRKEAINKFLETFKSMYDNITRWKVLPVEYVVSRNLVEDLCQVYKALSKSEYTPPRLIYRHFKGKLYEYVCEAITSSTCSERIVVYRTLDGQTFFYRSAEEFDEEVELPQPPIKVKRFTLVEEGGCNAE